MRYIIVCEKDVMRKHTTEDLNQRRNSWLGTFNMPDKVVKDYDVTERLSDRHEDNLQNINNFLKKDWIIIIIQSYPSKPEIIFGFLECHTYKN